VPAEAHAAGKANAGMRIAIAAGMNSAAGRRLTMRVARSRPPNLGALAHRSGLPVTSARLGDLVNNVFVNDSYAAPSPDDCGPGSFV